MKNSLEKGRGKPRKTTPLEDSIIKDLHGLGSPMYKITSQFKISESTVRRIVKRET